MGRLRRKRQIVALAGYNGWQRSGIHTRAIAVWDSTPAIGKPLIMHLIRGIKNWPDSSSTIVTIGNFDGAHAGHQAMFAATRRAADAKQLPATVISFEPLPHEYFNPEDAPPRLQGLRDRIYSAAHANMDRLLLLRFDKQLASMSAEEFVRQVLVHTARAAHIVVGDDFKFGHQRSGNYQSLLELSSDCNFSVEKSPTCMIEGESGRLDETTTLLGRPYRISGRVVHGEKVGRQLGFPTANVALGRHRPPLRGVFAVRATHLQSGECYDAVANLGERPTIGGRKLLLEVHALDASPHWYGHHLAVDFLHQLRAEKRFASLDELKLQIGKDAEDAREMLKA
jgi:riboflavin kinase/FMN adenylyltransferase